MQLDYHEQYALESIAILQKEHSIDKKLIDLILEGLLVADQHEFTHLFAGASVVKNPKDLVVYESHYGRLTAIHCMAFENGIKAIDTLQEVLLWADFYQQIALHKIRVTATQKMSDSKYSIASLCKNKTFTFKDFFDESNAKKYSGLAMGAYLHLLQDSYTHSHCERTKQGLIRGFYCYVDQNVSLHNTFDDVSKHLRKQLIRASCQLLHNLLIYKEPFDNHSFFRLSAKSQISGPGPFA